MFKKLPKKSRTLLAFVFALSLLFVLTSLTITVVIVNKSNKKDQINNNNSITSTTGIPSTPVTISDTQTLPTSTSDIQSNEKIIKIYFIKTSANDSDIAPTDFVQRKTTRTDIATFAIEQLLIGPTATEKSTGLSTPITLSGTSNCNRDFALNINSGKAEIKFCRQILTAGIGDDARISTVIKKTLMEFTSVQSVIILDKNDNCFGDESGLNLCKK